MEPSSGLLWASGRCSEAEAADSTFWWRRSKAEFIEELAPSFECQPSQAPAHASPQKVYGWQRVIQMLLDPTVGIKSPESSRQPEASRRAV
ncbi:hypothetical protein D9611_004215 [Ephemerocybe angulata]|uniref:Uncharacterized protein n=1 Tax=Ephemerocybe angulata TaxID=980116 RepID=A0A8H5F5T7_9AGAR|nr:hypothetical protein D9611_004215 [Tulosesus angulatus]